MEDIRGHFLNERTADLQLRLVCDPAAEVGWQSDSTSVDEQPSKRARLEADAPPERGTVLRRVPVHKLALAASSKLLDRQLYSEDFDKEQAYTLAVRPEELDAAMTVLRFIYLKDLSLGDASQSLSELSLVLGVANRWQVLSCIRKCIEEILALPAEAFNSCDTVNALFSLQRYDVDADSLQKLQKYTLTQLARLFAPKQERGLTTEQVQQAAQLSHAAMMALVSSDEQGLDSENTLALLALTWADRWSKQGLMQEVAQVVSHIHFQRCSPTFILDALPSILGLPGVSRRDQQLLTSIALAKAKGHDQVVEQCVKSGNELFGAPTAAATSDPTGSSSQSAGTSGQQQLLSLSLWQDRPKRKYSSTDAGVIRARLTRAGLAQILARPGEQVEVASCIIHGFSLQVVASFEPNPASVVFLLRTVPGANTPVLLQVSHAKLRSGTRTLTASSTGKLVLRQVMASLGAEVRVQPEAEGEGRDIVAFNSLFTDGPSGVGRVIDLEISLAGLDGVTLIAPPSPSPAVVHPWMANIADAAAWLQEAQQRPFWRERGMAEDVARLRARRLPVDRMRHRQGQQAAPAAGGPAAGNGNGNPAGGGAPAPAPAGGAAGAPAPANAPAPAAAQRGGVVRQQDAWDQHLMFILEEEEEDEDLFNLGEPWGGPRRAPARAPPAPAAHAADDANFWARHRAALLARRAAVPGLQQLAQALAPAPAPAGPPVAAAAAAPAGAPAAGEPPAVRRPRERQQQQQQQERERLRVRFAADPAVRE